MAKTILVGANHAGTACANTILSYPNQELTIYDPEWHFGSESRFIPETVSFMQNPKIFWRRVPR